jgi:hypothetical protein
MVKVYLYKAHLGALLVIIIFTEFSGMTDLSTVHQVLVCDISLHHDVAVKLHSSPDLLFCMPRPWVFLSAQRPSYQCLL